MAKMSTRRKLAISTWSAPREGNIYGKLTIDAGPAMAYIDKVRAETGEKVTITHLVGKAVAIALARTPGLNGRIVFGGFAPFETVDVTYLVALEEGGDLGKAKIARADTKTCAEIAADLRSRAGKLHRKEDAEFEKSKGLLKVLPTFLLRPLLFVIGWLGGALGVEIPALGVERFPFGSCIITSVGMFGLDEGFAPPTPFARVPLLVLVGAVRDRPAVIDGVIGVRTELTITATIDHRFIDGFQGGTLAKTVREVLESPELLDRRT